MIQIHGGRMLQETRKAQHQPNVFLQILIFFAIVLFSQLCTGIILSVPLTTWMFNNPEFMAAVSSGNLSSVIALASHLPEWVQLLSLYGTGLTTLFVILYCCKVEERSLRSMGFVRKGWYKHYLIGFVIGTLLLSLSLGLATALGSIDLSMSASVPGLTILLFLGGYIVQGMSEEVMLRGYFMMSLSNRVPLAVAVGLSSIVFSLLHILNPGFGPLPAINIALFGLLMALYVLRTDNLWGACAMHTAWNFFQGNFFGIRVSGNDLVSSLFTSNVKPSAALVNGADFGLEGGVAVTVVLVLATALVLFLPQSPRSPEAGELIETE